MKIKREDVFKMARAFKEVPYDPMTEKGDLIVFPIDMTKIVDNGGFELSIAPKNTIGGVAKEPEPMLILGKDDGNTIAILGYGDTTYGRKFSLEDYMDLLDYKVPKSVKELFQYDCLLLNQEYVFARFKA